MSANPIDVLKDNLHRAQRHRHRILSMRQFSLGLALMVAQFIVLSWLEMTFQFPLAGRLTLFGVLLSGVIAIALWGWRVSRLIHIDDRRMAHYVEDHMPELEQRLITSVEADDTSKTGWSSQLVERLWEDTHEQLQTRNLGQIISFRAAWPAAGAATLMTGFLLLALWHWSDFSRASKQVILPWTQTAAKIAFPVKLTVAPGDIKIPRGSDVMLIATVENVVPKKVELNMQTDGGDWTRVAMTREGNKLTYVYVLASLQQGMSYDVDIGVQRSHQHRIVVFDLPRVEQIAVAYTYPPYTGMTNKTVKDQGDVIAPEGTRITLHTTFNTPVDRATLRFGDGTTVALDTDGTEATGSFRVTKDSTYTLKLVDREQMEHEHPYEYVVRAIPDNPPMLTPIMPGGDRRVMALEEVSIAATAQDDYGLEKFLLHYSIAGGESRQVAFLQTANQRSDITAVGKTVLYLEELGLEPGDVITYYLTAVDNNAIQGPSETTSDIYFLEVRSTEEEFRRASGLGGARGGAGSGGGGPSSALVENQKQIIAATWKLLQKQKGMRQETVAAQVTVILDSQRQVMQRTQLSLRRLLERFSFSDASYDRAVEHLKQAVAHMQTAAEKLAAQNLQEALGPERLALQEVMKAQAESRKTLIQMARNRGAGGASSGMHREREDLRELFEMEMGRLENRYEIPPAGGGLHQAAGSEDALEKLRQLASRQERLNRRQRDLVRRHDQMTAGQKKRHLEELRREQEDLLRQAQELSRRMSRLVRQEGLRQWSDRQQRLAQAARQMQDASRSLQQLEPASAAAKGQMALDRLRDQEREMSRHRQATVASLIDDLKQKARNLQTMEKKVLEDLDKLTRLQDNMVPAAEAAPALGIKRVIERKDHMVRELAEAKTILQSLGKERLQGRPEIAARALDTLRSLQAEGLEARIEASQKRLQQGWLSLSMEAEKQIEPAVDRISDRLQALDHETPESQQKQTRQAAAEATRLRQELENLQQHIEVLRQGNQQQQRALSRLEAHPDQPQASGVAEREGDLDRMRQGWQRIRQYARGLTQPWSRGAPWSVDARAIERQVTQREIEDFLSQPDLWRNLLQPVKELEATLRAQVEVAQIKKRLFSASEQEVPTPYRHQVEEYYRDLSRQPKGL